jgi:hypothetical protein
MRLTTGDQLLRKISIGSGLAGLLLLALAACGSEPGGKDGNASEAANAAAPANASAAAPAPAPAARSPLVLEGAGIGIPDASPPRIVSFNTPKAAAIEALTKALGRPPTELGENEECGGGGLEYAKWMDEITLWFEEGRFAGWDNEGKLRTSGGIGIGSSRADLAPLAGLEVEESTLGTEFRAGGLSGILASKAADAKVTHLWGGATCVFR